MQIGWYEALPPFLQNSMSATMRCSVMVCSHVKSQHMSSYTTIFSFHCMLLLLILLHFQKSMYSVAGQFLFRVGVLLGRGLVC